VALQARLDSKEDATRGLGRSWTYDLPDPGAGSYFYLVVRTDGVSAESS
jgi:hypothetical protein